MPDPRRLSIKGVDGETFHVTGRAAEMAILLARHAAEINRHEQGTLEFSFHGGKLSVAIRATLERSTGRE